jgi:ZIP family zinc transporter
VAEFLIVLGLAALPAAANLVGGLIAELRRVPERSLSLALGGAVFGPVSVYVRG